MNDLDRITTGIAAARDILATEADAAVFETMNDLYHAGKGCWYLDPEVDGVVGFTEPDTNNAFIVVYIKDRDFEVSAEFDALMDAR